LVIGLVVFIHHYTPPPPRISTEHEKLSSRILGYSWVDDEILLHGGQ
jgi:hypothetical protein